VLLALGAVAPAAAAPAPDFADPDEARITPGVRMLTPLPDDGASACTASFVFAGVDALFLSYAAHCAGGGGSMGLDGCEVPTLRPGSPVIIEGRDGTRVRGTLAYSSWRTMQDQAETDRALCLYNDFALVAIDPADAGSVNPSVPVVGGPTGLDRDGTERGERVLSYQPHVSTAVQLKQGASLGDRAGGRTHRVVTDPPGDRGDSGSGFLDGGGAAFGVLSTRFLDLRDSNGVTDLAGALAYANRYGGLGEIALVPGTEPFVAPDSPLAP
jgi:hypothetical protein